jgi:predicted cupin superfamily sugar epimerase
MAVGTIQHWIRELQLERHPEGGWYRRIYESKQMPGASRPAMSSIYYLLEGDDFSALHRLKQDEQWHFYAGSPITIHMIDPKGGCSLATLSSDGAFQFTVRAGTLFGASVDGDFALVGCTVAPAFDYADFELPARESLLQQFPQHELLIRRLTRC